MSNVSKARDEGGYSCRAENRAGEAAEAEVQIDVIGELSFSH